VRGKAQTGEPHNFAPRCSEGLGNVTQHHSANSVKRSLAGQTGKVHDLPTQQDLRPL
jgi:hypothetical protein